MKGNWTALVQAEALADALSRLDLTIVDCRYSLADPQAGATAYRRGRLPGAVHADLGRDLSGQAAPGAGRHPWPSAEHLRARLGAWGISPRHQVVAYDDGDGAFAARLWFLLHALGHRRVAVLDGGWARWTALRLPIEETAPSTPMHVVHAADAFDDVRLYDAERVQAHLARGGLLLDARAGERFRGEVEPIDRIAGHVPGAVNRPYADNLADGRFKPAAVLRREFEALLDSRAPDGVVAMCGSGVTACHHLLAMEVAGLPGAGLYTGSWSGWIEDPARPVAAGPL